MKKTIDCMKKLPVLAVCLVLTVLVQSPVQAQGVESPVKGAQTIRICKKTTPSGGSGFPFSWANSSGALPSFNLNDGQCQTINLAKLDKFNKFQEIVPPGWTLSNIQCDSRTSPVKISGVNPDPLFQQGDTMVSIDLNETNVTCTFTNQEKPKENPNPCCPPWNPSLLKEMMFYQGSGSISAPYTLKFQPTPAFKNQMQAYINYLNSVNSAMTAITIAFVLYDQGTASLPLTQISGGNGSPVSTYSYATWNANTTGGNPNYYNPGFFAGFPMQVGTWYLVHTGIYLENGQHFFPKECADIDIFVRIQVMPRMRGGSVLEFSDGKKVIKTVPIQ